MPSVTDAERIASWVPFGLGATAAILSHVFGRPWLGVIFAAMTLAVVVLTMEHGPCRT